MEKYKQFTLAQLDLMYKCADGPSQPRDDIGLEIARRVKLKKK